MSDANSITSPDTGLDLTDIFAPIYWGFVMSLLLGGITIVQAYMYFPAHRDRAFVRYTAALMLILDLASSALIAQSVFYYLIPHFGSLKPLSSVTPELSAECLISTLITFNSQMYFVFQLYNVKRMGSGRWLVLGSIGACAVLSFAGGIACVTAMYIFHHGVLSDRNSTFAIFFGLAKGFGALTDILATAAMCIYLTSAKTGIAQTTTLLNRLMRFVVHRGAMVTLIQTLLLVTFYAAPRKLYWLPFHINVTKLYANTFFAMLNARTHLKDTWQARSSIALSHSLSGSAGGGGGGGGGGKYDLRALSDLHQESNFPDVSQSGHRCESRLATKSAGSCTMSMPMVTKTVEVADI